MFPFSNEIIWVNDASIKSARNVESQAKFRDIKVSQNSVRDMSICSSKSEENYRIKIS